MINDALRLIRVFHDISQSELAGRLGVPKSRISEIENNKRKPTLDLIEKYSEEFSLPLSMILFFAEALPNAKKGEKIRTAVAGKVLDMLKFIERQAND
jgi:transcriptional regulator with XRE-family HTH domain